MDSLRSVSTGSPAYVGRATEGASKGTSISGLSDDLQKINDALNNQKQALAILTDQLQNDFIDDPNKALDMQAKLEQLTLKLESQSTAMKVVFDMIKEMEEKIPPSLR